LKAPTGTVLSRLFANAIHQPTYHICRAEPISNVRHPLFLVGRFSRRKKGGKNFLVWISGYIFSITVPPSEGYMPMPAFEILDINPEYVRLLFQPNRIDDQGGSGSSTIKVRQHLQTPIKAFG
jgi:hypothetical protein